MRDVCLLLLPWVSCNRGAARHGAARRGAMRVRVAEVCSVAPQAGVRGPWVDCCVAGGTGEPRQKARRSVYGMERIALWPVSRSGP